MKKITKDGLDRIHVDRLIISTIPMSIILLDEDGMILETNPAVRTMLQRLEGELEGGFIGEVIPEYASVRPVRYTAGSIPGNLELLDDDSGSDIELVTSTLMQAIYQGSIMGGGARNIRCLTGSEKGPEVWARASINCDQLGQDTVYILTLYDVTDSVLHLDRMKYMATHDSLTGLLNEQGITRRLNTSPLTGGLFYCIDIRNFASLSAALGYRVCKDLIGIFVRELKDALKGHELEFARLVDGTFGILDYRASHQQKQQQILKVFSDLSFHSLEVSGLSIRLSLCGGIVKVEAKADGARLVNRGKIALAQLPEQNAFHSVLFDEQMETDSIERYRIANGVYTALANNEFYLVYQPIVDLSRDNKILGYETLVRWQSGGNVISPARFIPVLEASGGILELGEWIFARALQDFKACFEDASHLYISINLSGRQVEENAAFDKVLRILRESAIEPGRVKLELTETSNLRFDDKDILKKLKLLRAEGYGLSIDDFGTGHSTLARLDPDYFSELKIDRMFIEQIEARTRPPIILTNTIRLAQEFGIGIVAEGIENQTQLDFLASYPGIKGQGFFFHKPMPLKELISLVNSLGDNAIDQSQVC